MHTTRWKPNSGVQPTMQPTSTATASREGAVCSCNRCRPSSCTRRRNEPSTLQRLHEAGDDGLGADGRKVDRQLELAARAGEAAHLAFAKHGMAHTLAQLERALRFVVAGAFPVVLHAY